MRSNCFQPLGFFSECSSSCRKSELAYDCALMLLTACSFSGEPKLAAEAAEEHCGVEVTMGASEPLPSAPPGAPGLSGGSGEADPSSATTNSSLRPSDADAAPEGRVGVACAKGGWSSSGATEDTSNDPMALPFAGAGDPA